MPSNSARAAVATEQAAAEQMDEAIRQEIALLVDADDPRFSIQLDQGRVTLFGAVEHQQELGELASQLCSIPAVTQIQTRFWFDPTA